MSRVPKFGICTLPVLPMRAAAAHAAEMASELIFGECFEILGRRPGHWIHIRSAEDAYEGWCNIRQPVEVEESLYQERHEPLAADWVNEIILDGSLMKIPLGSRLKGLKQGKAFWGGCKLIYHGNLIAVEKQLPTEVFFRNSTLMYLNSGYLWGGKSVFGLDCSGFTQSVYRMMGIHIPRDAWQQQLEGRTVESIGDARLGDLAFFNQGSGRPTHVGILFGDRQIIHASGMVKIDQVDAQGIFIPASKEYTHQLIGIKRYIWLPEKGNFT